MLQRRRELLANDAGKISGSMAEELGMQHFLKVNFTVICTPQHRTGDRLERTALAHPGRRPAVAVRG